MSTCRYGKGRLYQPAILAVWGVSRVDLFDVHLCRPALDADDFAVRKRIIWSSTKATDAEVRHKEREIILERGTNNPDIGYNLFHASLTDKT